MIQDLLKTKELYKLKEITRTHHVTEDRKESDADHTYSCIILAKYFLPLVKKEYPNLNEQRIFDLILFHDVAEIESGDNPKTNPKFSKKEQKEAEFAGMKKLLSKIPTSIAKNYEDCFNEYEEQETTESKFAKAIDHFDSIIQAIGFKNNWVEFKITEEKMDEWHKNHIYKFQATKQAYDEIQDYLEKEDYFWKE